MRKKIRYVIGLDIGIASVGWAALLLDENDNVCGIVRAGVHTFDEAVVGQSKITGAAYRRGYRSGRRSIRRKVNRIQRVKNLLQRLNIISKKDLEEYFSGAVENIYYLRCAAIQNEPAYILNNKELAQLLIYYAKHRGYKSNTSYEQKTDDSKKVLSALSENKKYMLEKGYQTAGEMLYRDEKFRRKRYGSSEECELLLVRNSGDDYSHSISRELLVEEVHVIFARQRELGNKLTTKELEDQFVEIMQSQRNYDEGPGEGSPYGGNLIEKMVGECTFEKGEKRACKASYTSERFVLLEKLNHLRIQSKNGDVRALTEEERDAIIKLAYKNKDVKYKALRTILKLDPDERFGGLTYSRGDIENSTEGKSVFVSLEYWYEIKKVLGLSYDDLDNEETQQLLDSIGTILTCYKSDDLRRRKIEELHLDQEKIEHLLALNYTKFQNLSFKAMKNIMPELEKGLSYTEACSNAGYGDKETIEGKNKYISKELLNETLDSIMNPTVKRAVRRTIRILNELIKQYGSPVEVHVEMARDLTHSQTVTNKMEKRQNENKAEKEEAKRFICENFRKTETQVSGKDILRYRLWKSQNQIDIYTNTMIPVSDILDYEKYEVDHIIPYSCSFNDSFNNKMLVRKKDNQDKKNRTPYEYIGSDEKKWEAFAACANTYVLNYGKRKNMLTKVPASNTGEWMSRNLNDTRYTTKVVTDLIRKHLKFEAYVDQKRKKHVYPINGGITAKLRYEWGLEKDREKSDKHHAQDAVVIACCTDGMIQRLSRQYMLQEIGIVTWKNHKLVDRRTGEIIEETNLPWKCFREEVEMFMADSPEDYIEKAKKNGYKGEAPKPIFVSRLPQKKTTGKINEDTLRCVQIDSKGKARFVNKTKLPDLKLVEVDGKKQIKDYYRPEDDKLLYDKLLACLVKNDDAKVAFAEPFYKPKRDGTDGPIVKSVKTYGEPADDLVAVDKGIAERGKIYRCDIFRRNSKYYMIPVYFRDLYAGELPTKAVRAKKKYSEWIEMDEKDYIFSLYPDDLIRINKDGRDYYGYYKSCDRSDARIKYKFHDSNSSKYIVTAIQKLNVFEKMNVDILGNIYKGNKEEREWN